MSTLATVIEAVAITVVFVRGSIFKRLRESGPALWRELASCPLCAGVWIGAGWSILRVALVGTLHADAWPELAVRALATGTLAGSFALLFVLTLSVLDKHS